MRRSSVVAAGMLAAAAGGLAAVPSSAGPAVADTAASGTAAPPAAATAAPTVIAAGDIACEVLPPARRPRCHEGFTSDVVLAANPRLVLTLGDHQYSAFLWSNWMDRYDPTWGRFKSRTRPVPGNHEFEPDPATGANAAAENYDRYFGALAHQEFGGYYAYDVGTWRVYALNSTSGASEQLAWLAADMTAHPRRCTLGYWHHAAYDSGRHYRRPVPARESAQQLWAAFVAGGGDVVLNGHAHFYERIKVGNVREFIVGTGGVYFSPMAADPSPYTEVRNGNTYGVLRLRLGAGYYGWRFLNDGHSGSFTDAGRAPCANPVHQR